MTNFGKRPSAWKQLGAAVCISGIAGAAFSAQALAQQAPAQTSERPAPYAMAPESGTLPEKVLRARIPVISATNSGAAYDIDGKKIEGGVTANVMASGLALEYGITDKLSFGFLMPYVVKSELGVDGDKYKNQRGYFVSKRAAYESTGAVLSGQGLCAAGAGCDALIESGWAFPSDQEVTLSSGEKATIKAGVPVKQGLNSLILNAAVPKSGETGMGDIDMGLKYRWLNEGTMGHAVGLVVHLPTGKYEDVTLSQRATGRGIMEIGLRSSFDYKINDNYIAGWQHTVDYAVGKGKIKRSKILDNTQFNDAETTGDGFANNEEFERPGARNSGFIDVKTSFAQFSSDLKAFGGKVRYSYDFDTAVRVQDSELIQSNGFRGVGERSSIHQLGLGVNWDGFQLENRIPVRLTYDLDMPIMGSNKSVAPLRNTFITELYYKF
ncbi:hypothetical protein EBZ80_08175 [bacterium]|nr:hypothetical protein [bacterium]